LKSKKKKGIHWKYFTLLQMSLNNPFRWIARAQSDIFSYLSMAFEMRAGDT